MLSLHVNEVVYTTQSLCLYYCSKTFCILLINTVKVAFCKCNNFLSFLYVTRTHQDMR